MPTRRNVKRYRLTWREWKIELRHTIDYLGMGEDMLEVQVKSPAGAPLPITETGYRATFPRSDIIASAGGPVAYITAQLDAEARSKAWPKMLAKWSQLEFELVLPKAKPAPTPARAAKAHARKRRPQP